MFKVLPFLIALSVITVISTVGHFTMETKLLSGKIFYV